MTSTSKSQRDLPNATSPAETHTKWFSDIGCVVQRGEQVDVLVAGRLISSFDKREVGLRNLALVLLAKDPGMHLGRLAKAFGLSAQGLKLIRDLYEVGGPQAVLDRRRRGGVSVVGERLRLKMESLFEKGKTIDEVQRLVGRSKKMSRATVGRFHARWAVAKKRAVSEPKPELVPQQREMAFASVVAVVEGTSEPMASVEAAPGEEVPPIRASRESDKSPRMAIANEETARFDVGVVQHLGAWLMVAMIARLGLYAEAQRLGKDRVTHRALRLALDVVVIALSTGEKCVEGVRRLATSSAAALLLATRAPSPNWARRTLGRFATDGGGLALHLLMAKEHLEAAREDALGHIPVFYVDNHLRPYTGKHVVRRGWRMQDKRVRAGTSDYYVHDEDGRPIGRLPVPAHDSLTTWLSPISRMVRLALGGEETILLAFDRAGAFPAQMAELRDEKFEFVTYERKPYPVLSASLFTEKVFVKGEKLSLYESRINLGSGRGRVRRIAVRMPDGYQVNLVAVSELPAKRLVEVMRGRWVQENGFKHGVERWGMNQLDGRTVVPYPPETIIPNPARGRLDRALRLARTREGLARSELARLHKSDGRCERWTLELKEALAEQKKLEALRPSTPKRAQLKDTELADKLVHHTPEYKMTVDTIRIACANAEADLAGELAPFLPRPTEAKKTLANLLAAPGRIRMGKQTIGVCLQPAGTKREQQALSALLNVVNGWNLTLPADPTRRRLRFKTAALS